MSSRWTRTASGTATGGMIADAAEVRRAIELFADPAHGFELMGLVSGVHRTLSGSEVDSLVSAAEEMPDGVGIYFRLNPVPDTLRKAAANGDVLSRRWLYIDVDPIKDEQFANHPATDAEKSRTGTVADAINEHLQSLGWPVPVVTDSGNGCGLFFRCDLHNDKLTQLAYQSALRKLAEQFNGPNGTVDKSIHNAARLAKLPGTWARKGKESEGRPHRPCRLVYVPERIECVTFDMLRAVGGKSEEKEQPTSPSPSSNGTYAHARDATQEERRKTAYGRKALESECVRILLSRPPALGGTGRRNAVRDGAFRMGQLLAGGALKSREHIEDQLASAAQRNGIADEEKGIFALIRESIDAGMKSQARSAPEQPPDPQVRWNKSPGESGQLTPPGDEPKGKPLTIKLSNVKPQQVEWLIRHRIPKRFITVFAGRTGVGKSFVTHDLIARLSTGGEIPLSGGECFEPAGTLIISEDSHEFVLAPRLIEAGADLSRIHAMTWEAMAKYHLGDTDMLSQACDEVGGAKVVVIDPPTNFLMETDEHKNSEVRQLVMRVVEWALSRDVAVIFILHVNKQTGKGIEALNRVMGSVAWVTTARIAHTFCADPNDGERSLWVPLKNNLGPIAKALAYRIVPTEDDQARVEWIEEVDTTADEAMGHAAPRERSDVAAAKWLVERFREKLKWPSTELFRAAKEANISRNAVFAAKTILKLPTARKVTHENGDSEYVWWVPEDWIGFDNDKSDKAGVPE